MLLLPGGKCQRIGGAKGLGEVGDPTLEEKPVVSTEDRRLLRDLAKRVAEVAALPVMAERREQWMRHNALAPGRPLLLIFPEGAWRELLPESGLRCVGEEPRRMELQLRQSLYCHEHFQDDTVIEREWPVHKVVRETGWGLEPRRIPSPSPTGAWKFDPVIHAASDLKKLTFPEVTYDEAATRRRLALAQDLFGDSLDVRLRGVCHVSFHLMAHYTQLRGLEEVMLDMAENPNMLHEAMAFFVEGHRRRITQYEEQHLLDLNNDGTYHSSGGVGYTRELPRRKVAAASVRPEDMWASAESQELAQVSPEMHAEFALAYEKRLLAPFGLTGYGCCEDLTRKLDHVFTIPHIRRISIAPFADVARCAEKLGDRYIFSWKPRPSMLVGEFNEEAVRAYIRRALAATRGCVLEIILKDTHTCEGHPERFDRWCRIAREEVEEGA